MSVYCILGCVLLLGNYPGLEHIFKHLPLWLLHWLMVANQITQCGELNYWHTLLGGHLLILVREFKCYLITSRASPQPEYFLWTTCSIEKVVIQLGTCEFQKGNKDLLLSVLLYCTRNNHFVSLWVLQEASTLLTSCTLKWSQPHVLLSYKIHPGRKYYIVALPLEFVHASSLGVQWRGPWALPQCQAFIAQCYPVTCFLTLKLSLP